MTASRDSQTILNAASYDAVRETAHDLSVKSIFTNNARAESVRAFRGATFERMLAAPGLTHGEATEAPEMPSFWQPHDLDAFRESLRAIDNDLAEQLAIVRRGITHYFEHGEVPPPYYPYRIAVILRTEKQLDLEVTFLRAWLLHFKHGPGTRYAELAKRLPKAEALLAKAKAKLVRDS